MIRSNILVVAMVHVLVVLAVLPCAALDLKHYWELPDIVKAIACREAALANPGIVGQLNEAAGRCAGQILADIALLAKTHPVLMGIQNEKPRLPKDNEAVVWEMEYSKNTRSVETPSAVIRSPDKDGIILIISIHNYLGGRGVHMRHGSSFHEWFLVHEMETHARYLLKLGENYKELERPMRDILDKHIKAFCETAKKLQTVEDKAAQP